MTSKYNLKDVKDFSDLHLNPNDILKYNKTQLMLNYVQAKEENPQLTQPQLCALIGTSKSVIQRTRTDIQMDSPHRYTVPLKQKQKKKDEQKILKEVKP